MHKDTSPLLYSTSIVRFGSVQTPPPSLPPSRLIRPESPEMTHRVGSQRAASKPGTQRMNVHTPHCFLNLDPRPRLREFEIFAAVAPATDGGPRPPMTLTKEGVDPPATQHWADRSLCAAD